MNKKIDHLILILTILISLSFRLTQGYSIELVSETKQEGFKPTFNLDGRIQFKHKYNKSKGREALGEQSNSFAIRRLWIDLYGNLYPDINYSVTLFLENAIASQGKGILGYAVVQYTPSVHFNLQLGVDVVNFTRGFPKSNRYLLLIDYASAPSSNGIDDDIGLVFKGSFLNDQLKYWVGVINGAGGTSYGVNGFRQSKVETNTSFDYYVRLQVDPFGSWENGKVYHQRDLKWSLGVAFYFSPQRDPRVGMAYAGTKNYIGLTFDMGLNVGIFFFEGAFIYHDAQASNVYGTVTPNSTAVEDYVAYYADIGIAVLPQYITLAARFDTYEEYAGQKKDDTIREIDIALNWFIGGRKDRFKFQTEVGYQIDKGKETSNAGNKEIEWRNQLTLLF